MIHAAAYYRMSTDKQETSIPDQRKAVEKYAAENGYRIVAEYLDEGISGSESTARKGFTRLIDEASAGKFRVVLCWDIDRFSRFDPLEANHYWYLLDKAGVALATVTQGRIDWHDLGGWLSASVQQHGKAQYLRDLSKNVVRGILAKKMAGGWLGRPPYGYALENGRLVLGDPAAMAVVRRIFEMRARGAVLVDIAKALNSEGISTPKGARWSTVHVGIVLRRDAYRGAVVIGKHSTAKFNRVTDEVIVIEDAHPAIIDRPTWDTVQAMPRLIRGGNGRGGGQGGILTGLVFCGLCGGPMYCNRVTGGNWYYICHNYSAGALRTGIKCGHCCVKKEVLEAEIIDKLRENLFLGSRRALQKAIAREFRAQQSPAGSDDIKPLRARLAALNVKVEKATGQILLLDADLVPMAQVKLRGLVAERDACAAALASAQRPPEQIESPNAVAKRLWNLADSLFACPIPEARGILSMLIERIEIDFALDEKRSTPKRQRYTRTGGTLVIRTADAATMVRYCLAVCKAEGRQIPLSAAPQSKA